MGLWVDLSMSMLQSAPRYSICCPGNQGVCQSMDFPVYSARRSDQWESVSTNPFVKDRVTVFAKVATPPKAQHPQPLRLKNYWRRQIWRALDFPTTEGAHDASCNLSGTKDRWA